MKMLFSPRKIKAGCGSDAYVATKDVGASRDVGVAPTKGVDDFHVKASHPCDWISASLPE